MSTPESFIAALTGLHAGEIKKYAVEIGSDWKFRDNLEKNRRNVGRGRSYSRGISVGAELSNILYELCRYFNPDIVVETGVARGISSSYILGALEANNKGHLYSIDMPGEEEGESGWLIPDYLKHRWHLTTGRTADKLQPLLAGLSKIDIFLHDSEHTYENMTWEFRLTWQHLKPGGLLLSHNIDYNDAFTDFCRSVGLEGCILNETGGLVKPSIRL